jgi:excisionase family DNA binding protein
MGTDSESKIFQKLEQLEKLLFEQNLLQKQVYNVKEAAHYLSMSRANLYQLTHKKLIRYYCPGGKNLAFRRTDLDEYLLQNPNYTVADSHQQVHQFLARQSPRLTDN